MRLDVQEFINGTGLEVHSETADELILFCPFHNNIDTPSFSINKTTGLWQCFNPQCGKTGRFQALTKILKGEEYQVVDNSTYDDVVKLWGLEKEDDVEIKLDNVVIDYESDDIENLQYLVDRGFLIETLEYFDIGFSKKQDRVVIPVRDVNFKVVGLIGRAYDVNVVPKYLYSKGFRRRHHLFNLQNAKYFDSVIITEGSLDAIKVHQAGFKNVVATLGAQLSPEQADLLNRNFDELVIFADNDDAGARLKSAIMEGCPKKGIKIVTYPEGIKDPGEMTEEQIGECIEKAVDIFENLLLNI